MSKRPPFYQSIINTLPSRRAANTTARALGYLFGPSITAQVNLFSMKLDLREYIQREMFLGRYDPEQTEWFRRCLCPGDAVIDVGASFGYYTTLAATLVGPAGRVFAFEPSPIASAVIEEALKEAHNVVLTKAAVGKTKGTTSLFFDTSKYLHTPSVLESDPSLIPIQVPVITLDQFEPLQNVAKIKLIKIGVEGYEPDVLDGMEGLIKANRVENVICEFNSWWLKRNSTTSKQLRDRFMDFGYQIRMQTKCETLKSQGEMYDLQDVWFSIS